MIRRKGWSTLVHGSRHRADIGVSKVSVYLGYHRFMKTIALVGLIAIALLPGAALAQGQSNSNRPDSPPGQENRPNTSSGQGNRPDSPPGQSNRPDNPPGQADRSEESPGRGNRPETPPGLDDAQDERPSPSSNGGGRSPAGPLAEPGAPNASAADQALEAVESGRAVPLDRVLNQARSATGGDLIDTQLMTVQGFLLYELRMLLPDGRVERMYYYANTGNPVTMN
jgi:hypothetical protein